MRARRHVQGAPLRREADRLANAVQILAALRLVRAVTATEYLAQLCPHGCGTRCFCLKCHREDATELLALRERAAQWDGKAPGLARTIDELRERCSTLDAETLGLTAKISELRDQLHEEGIGFERTIAELREVLHEFAVAGIERDAGKYLVIQISHETMEEARRLTR